jgi:C1A family cysteine protease
VADADVPTSIDLRDKMPAVYDQGEFGSSTANALCGAVQFLSGQQGSRLFLYYNERNLENDISDDVAVQLSDGVACLETYGICDEVDWTYDIEKITDAPPKKCYDLAKANKVAVAKNINDNAVSMKKCLAAGSPFVVGISVFSSFETDTVAKTGVVPMPNLIKDKCLGGHAVLVVGYNDATNQWIVRNSWGSTWGDKGYFYLPYAYLLDANLSSDMWVIIKENEPSVTIVPPTEPPAPIQTISLDVIRIQNGQAQNLNLQLETYVNKDGQVVLGDVKAQHQNPPGEIPTVVQVGLTKRWWSCGC